MMLIMNNSPTARDTRPQRVRSATARDPKPRLVPSKANTRLLPRTNVLQDFAMLKSSSSWSKAINNINLDHGRTAKHEGKSKPVQVAPHNATWMATTGGPEHKNVSLSKPVFSVNVTRTLSDSRKIAPMQGKDDLLNLWTPTPVPATLHRLTPMAQYDINSKLPFHILETDQIRLEPLVPAKHLEGFMSLPKGSWDVLGDMGPYETPEAALGDIEEFRKDPRSLLLAAIDKQRESKGMDCFAGVYGLIEYNVDEGNILFGLINVHPRYHRTHVNSHAMRLILSFLFEEVKVLRVQYDAVTFNEASICAALRFGFKAEGICRNLHGIVPHAKRREEEKERVSQDLWLSSMTDTEWNEEGRERLRGMCEREPVDTTKF